MKLKKLNPKTLFVYKRGQHAKKENETDPTTTVMTTTVTGVFFGK